MGAVHERTWKGTHEGVVAGAGKHVNEVGQRLATLLTGYSRHAACKKAKQDLKKPNASPTSATGYGTWKRIA
jgi:hypothetical protein